MYGHPSHVSPIGYTRKSTRLERAATLTLDVAFVLAAGSFVAVPWWFGVSFLLGAL